MTQATAGGAIPPVDSAFGGVAALPPPPPGRKRWRPFGQPVSAYDQKSAMLFLAPMWPCSWSSRCFRSSIRSRSACST